MEIIMDNGNLKLSINKIIEDIISLFPTGKSKITEVDVNAHIYEIKITPTIDNLCPFKFSILKEEFEVLMFINDVSGAYYEGCIDDDTVEIKEIIKTVLKSEIRIKEYYRKGKNISKKVVFSIDGKNIDSFLYSESLFWKLLYKEKKEIIYHPWIN